MTGLNRFSFDSLPVSAWRNGGGETREIISWPVGQAQFDWRASIATIAADGPFSRFEGIDRSITLLSGAGVLLSAEGEAERRLDIPAHPFAFAGETPIYARLIEDVTTDFNIMTRRGRAWANVVAQRSGFTASRRCAGLLYVLRGQWQAGEAITLSASEGVFWIPESEEEPLPELHVEPRAAESLLLWVEIGTPRQRAAAI